MAPEIVVALLSLIGTLIGTLAGILASNKLTNHRIEQLEKKVEKHNSIVERTFCLEGRVTEAEHNYIALKEEVEEHKKNFLLVHPPK